MPNEKRAIRSRLDFSKIPTATQIPNLIEVQRRSYERFLQMDKLPNERDDSGLQSVFVSVFPITDFRGISQLDFVDFSIGNWECKCGHLKGLHHLRTACVHCGAMVITDPFLPGDVLCQKCGTISQTQTERVSSTDPQPNRKRKRRGARGNRTSGETSFRVWNRSNALIRRVFERRPGGEWRSGKNSEC